MLFYSTTFLSLRGLTEDFKVAKNTCKECEFENIQRVYYVDREHVYVIYTEFKKVECKELVFKSKDDITFKAQRLPKYCRR